MTHTWCMMRKKRCSRNIANHLLGLISTWKRMQTSAETSPIALRHKEHKSLTSIHFFASVSLICNIEHRITSYVPL